MNEPYAIYRLGSRYLLINSDDVPYLNSNEASKVKTVSLDLKYRYIDPLTNLQTQLKFNAWEEVESTERDSIMREIVSIFSEQDVLQRIIAPLTESLIKGS